VHLAVLRTLLLLPAFERMLRQGVLRLTGAALVSAGMAAAAAAAPAAPLFPVARSGAQVDARCTALLGDVARLERRVAAGEPRTGNVLAGMDAIARAIDERLAPIAFQAHVHPRKPVRDAAEACSLRFQDFAGRLYQNAKIHARIEALAPGDAVDRHMREDLLASFEDAGVALTPAHRATARRLGNEMAELSQAFERRVREDDTRVAFTEAELDGVPPGVWRNAPRDAQGRVLLGLDYPVYGPVMENAHSPVARERMWRAFQARGGQDNLERLDALAAKRRAYAQLFGLRSYAEFQLRRRMAADVATVQAFLGEVKAAVEARERRDLAELRSAKAGALEQAPGDTRLERWDVGYFIERVKRERFALDQERFRRHFPPRASVDFVFALAGRLFGVGFRPLSQPLWHPEARAYEVFEQGGGDRLATMYLDLYPRENKYGHAAVWSLQGSSTQGGRLPAAALVTNFDRRGLTLDELETLLHEFGHALHTALSNTRYASQSGTSVELDFVEAPSQMLEEWVYDARVMRLFGTVCPACEPVPDDLLERARQSRSFGKGLRFARQHLYASYDLALHSSEAAEPMALWARMEAATPLSHEAGSMFPANFSHLAGGYGAGYYAYLWSLATAQDLYTAFAADPLDASVGRRFRDTVLAHGGQLEPTVLVTRFLGRSPSNEAFFDWLAQ
jgi:thimet oligopeptidase